jgi:hypothetical protein
VVVASSVGGDGNDDKKFNVRISRIKSDVSNSSKLSMSRGARNIEINLAWSFVNFELIAMPGQGFEATRSSVTSTLLIRLPVYLAP